LVFAWLSSINLKIQGSGFHCCFYSIFILSGNVKYDENVFSDTV
jgi:hypothetical protein